jgi:hypothetical protein
MGMGVGGEGGFVGVVSVRGNPNHIIKKENTLIKELDWAKEECVLVPLTKQ